MPTSFTRSPFHEDAAGTDRTAANSTHSKFMLLCCLMMAAGTAIVVASVPSSATIADRFWFAVPLIGCAAMHFAMHRFLGGCAQAGRSQHRKNGEQSDV